ncbi:MAG TPA: hypothetical protein VEP90_23515, partial [Methylomirabilota bacterium]|nr:hypothetical protein [Methylomirabilota bacterium]
MSKTKTIRLLLVLGVLILGALVNFVPRTQVHADYGTPSWWTFSDSSHQHCDSGNFGNSYHLLTTWNGLEVCGYGPDQGGSEVSVTFPGGHGEYEWDCTELVKRYLYLAFGANAISANGDQ